ncbi:GNAT family N-acetyltransferase [Streptomyces sp. NPDC053541]|uniref:GNAT family N-acetyltransferase n=2 Tax=unclassified Streptomyces TaxID=2593676 RepID=UPI0037D1A5B0
MPAPHSAPDTTTVTVADGAPDSAPAPAPATGPDWTARPATPADVETVAELKARVMRPDLERLGRYDPHRVRQRLRDEFRPAHTTVVEVDGAFAGCVSFAPYKAGPGYYVEHFYLAPETRGRGLGTAVLRTLLARADAEGAPVHLVVVQGSAARRLYEREGFTVESEDPIDVLMVRPAGGPGTADAAQAASSPAGSAISAVPTVRKPSRA